MLKEVTKMAVKTGVSMISFIITKEMRKKASSNSYKLPKAEQKKSEPIIR